MPPFVKPFVHAETLRSRVSAWRELREDLSEVRFRVHFGVLSGETRHFRDESDVMGYLWEKLRELETAGLANQGGAGR